MAAVVLSSLFGLSRWEIRSSSIMTSSALARASLPDMPWGQMAEWPLADDVLALTGNDRVLTIDLRARAGAWKRATPGTTAPAFDESRAALD